MVRHRTLTPTFVSSNLTTPAKGGLISMDTKKCSKCGQELPLTEFYSRGNGRLRSECKKCHKNYVKSKYYERKEKK